MPRRLYNHEDKWLTLQQCNQLGLSVGGLNAKNFGVSNYERTHRFQQTHKKYIKPDQAKVDKRRNQYLKDNYNISLEDYNKMVEIQNGLCAICNQSPKEGEYLHVDHNHTTNIIRDLLCNWCNTNLSTFELYPEQTIAYGKRHGFIKESECQS